MQKITKEDLQLVKELVCKINTEDIKEILKKIPSEKRAYLLNVMYELVIDENKNIKLDNVIEDMEDKKQTINNTIEYKKIK